MPCRRDISYNLNETGPWMCRLGFCPVVPLEWNTVVCSDSGIQVISFSLNASVGRAGM